MKLAGKKIGRLEQWPETLKTAVFVTRQEDFRDKLKLRGTRIIENHPPKFCSKRFSGYRKRTCGQADGGTDGQRRAHDSFFSLKIKNMQKRRKI